MNTRRKTRTVTLEATKPRERVGSLRRTIRRLMAKEGLENERTVHPADLAIGRLLLGRDMTPRAVMKSVHRRCDAYWRTINNPGEPVSEGGEDDAA